MLGLLASGLEVAQGDWQLAWSDEFAGNTLNKTNWTFDIGNGNNGWGNNELEHNELEYYTSRTQNVYVANGLLHIVAQKESYQEFN